MVRAREVDAQQTWGCWRRPPSTAGAASSPPPSAHETPPPWPPRLCDRRQPFRQRGIFCYRLFGRRSHSSQFGSELSIAFCEVGPLPFSIVLMRLGVRPLLDGQPEEAFQLGPKGRESEVYLARFCRFRCYVVSDCPKASVASCSMAGCSGLCVSKTRNSSAGSIAKPPSSVLCAESLPSRMARQMSTLLVLAFSAASSRLREPIASHPARPCRGRGWEVAVNEALTMRRFDFDEPEDQVAIALVSMARNFPRWNTRCASAIWSGVILAALGRLRSGLSPSRALAGPPSREHSPRAFLRLRGHDAARGTGR